MTEAESGRILMTPSAKCIFLWFYMPAAPLDYVSLSTCALRLASKNSVSISPTSCGSICVRPEILAMIEAGVSSCNAYLRGAKRTRQL